jgi:LysR family transcriptional regulator, hydrogen peroxide-inducible genes activator
MPNLRQLEYLVALSETLHFRRAAERVNTTQPTLSEQLKALEGRLGVQLVERSKSKVLLTPIGEQVVLVARRMLKDANEIRSMAAHSRHSLTGVVKLGLPPTIGPYLLPKIIPDLQKHYEGLRLYVRESVPSRLVPELEDGRYDLIISLLPIQRVELESEPLFEEPLHLVVAHDHPFAEEAVLKWDALAGSDVLTLGEGHQLHEAVRVICDRVGSNLRTDYEGTSLDTLREMVAMNLGVTFLPGLYVESVVRTDPSVRVVELQGKKISRTVGLVWRKTSTIDSQFRALAKLLRDEVSLHFSEYSIVDPT